MNYAGKLKRQKRADQGRTAHWKKAIVTLAPGEKDRIHLALRLNRFHPFPNSPSYGPYKPWPKTAR